MIGKSLGERFGLAALPSERAIAILTEALPKLAKPIVEVRAQSLVACVVVDATKAAVQLCRSAGLDMKLGGSGVFGLAGEDAAILLETATVEQRAWLAAPSGPRETKVLLVAAGYALIALDAENGKVTARPGP